MKIYELSTIQKYRVKQWFIAQRARRAGRKLTAEELCCADEIIADEDLIDLDFSDADFNYDGLYMPGKGTGR